MKYSFGKIRKLICKLDDLRQEDDELSDEYDDKLFNYINEKQLNKEKCNEFIIEKL